MPIQSIPIGPPFTLVKDVYYALPIQKCTLFTDSAAGGIEISNVLGGSNYAPAATNGMFTVSGGFIRTQVVGGKLITLKRD